MSDAKEREKGMIEIKSSGERKAELIRNKRRGLKLKVRIDPSHTEIYCECCSLNFEGCLYLCKDFERVTGTRHFWFERDED